MQQGLISSVFIEAYLGGSGEEMNSNDKSRGQGRPKRESGGVGPDTIIEAARTLLRRLPKAEITRKIVAQAAGVTPALVSYYFVEQSKLLQAAANPIVLGYMGQLYGIINSSKPEAASLKQILRLFIMFNKTEALLLENYLYMIKTDERLALEYGNIEQAYTDLVAFVERIQVNEDWPRPQASWLVFALWGMCKSIAQTPILPLKMPDQNLSDADLITQQTEDAFALVSGSGPATLAIPAARQDIAHGVA